MTKTAIDKDLQAQRDYVERLNAEGFAYDLAVGDAFVRGMREIGYKSTSFALAELIDNAIQSHAAHVDIAFEFGTGSKPSSIAVVDDGHGMEPDMLRLALIWGGTHREMDGRKGFGRFGYGLPSASISQARRVEVYSRVAGGDWWRARLDVDEIADGKWTQANRIVMPEAEKVKLPLFVANYVKKRDPAFSDDLAHGTVVLLRHLDRTDYKTQKSMVNQLVTDFGVVYRNYLANIDMRVDGVDVEPTDPLFLTPGSRYYDLDDDRAIAEGEQPAVLDVKDKSTGKLLGQLRVRYARLPATFFRKPEAKTTHKPSKAHMNERLETASANNGIIFTRHGRQIDVVRPPRNLMSINVTTDRFWAVEVDFDATLDEEFRITTSKQQVVPSQKIWDILVDRAGLKSAIAKMRKQYDVEASKVRTHADDKEDGKRASEETMEQAARFKTRRVPDSPIRDQKAAENLEKEAERRAKASGRDTDDVMRELVAQQQGQPYRVAYESHPGGPFYRPEQQGAQKVLFLNESHRFFTDLYAGPDSPPRIRAALEVLLWVLAEAEMDANEDRLEFYMRERAHWSQELHSSLGQLSGFPIVAEAGSGSATEDDVTAA